MNRIAIDHLTKRYGDRVAVDDLTLAVDEGSVCGLLGPNGAGKSTTFKCLLGLARFGGSITVGGAPVGPATFETLGYVPERNALYDWLTVAEHFIIARRSYKHYDAARAAELCALFKLDSRKKLKTLSKGQQTAVALALAFSIRPRVLVLDEPASGLDPIFQRAVLDLIIDAAAGGATVLFSSHQIGQVERAADRIAILRGGKLVLDGDIDLLKGSEKIVEAVFPGDLPSMAQFDADQRVRRVERSGRIVRAFVRSDAPGIARSLEALGPRAVTVVDLGLEDIFLGAVGAEAAQNGTN
ncbi:MAG: ABC transporter ATP-binding protein [Vulcanimicrobiaceae bacterium]